MVRGGKCHGGSGKKKQKKKKEKRKKSNVVMPRQGVGIEMKCV